MLCIRSFKIYLLLKRWNNNKKTHLLWPNSVLFIFLLFSAKLQQFSDGTLYCKDPRIIQGKQKKTKNLVRTSGHQTIRWASTLATVVRKKLPFKREEPPTYPGFGKGWTSAATSMECRGGRQDKHMPWNRARD